MTLTVCWSAKGGSGTTVVAAAFALGSSIDSLLVDLDGELPAALGRARAERPRPQRLVRLRRPGTLPSSTSPSRRRQQHSARPPRAGADPPGLAPLACAATFLADVAARGHRRRRLRGTARRPTRRPGARPARHPAVLPGAVAGLPPAAARRRRARRGAGPQPDRRRRRPRRRRARRRPRHRRPGRSPAPSTPACSPPACPGPWSSRCRPCGSRHERHLGGRRQRRRRTTRRGAVPGSTGRAGQRRAGSARARPPPRATRRRDAPGTAWSTPLSLASTGSARSTRCSAMPPSTRSSSTAAARSGSSGAGELERRGSIAAADLAVVIERILAPLGRRLDRTTPIVDARLADGTRVCAVVPPISVDGTILSLRRFRDEPLPLTAFGGSAVTDVLGELVERRCNTVISGATSSGKTSLLSSLLGLARPGERIVVLEDTAELAPLADHVVRLEARPASNDGVAAIIGRAAPAHRPAPASRPPRRRRSSRPRGPRARPGAEHRTRRLVVDLSRQQRPRRATSARDARRPGRPVVAAARRSRPPRALHRRRRPRRADCRRVSPGQRDRRGRRRWW